VRLATQEEPKNLLSGIGEIFQSKPKGGSVPSSNPDSLHSSTSEGLSPESERLLAGVRGSIGSASEDEPGSTGEDAEAVAGLMAMVAFEPEDVQDTVCEFFEWLAVRFESDHWKLTDRQARMMGRPTAQLLNSLWARLQAVLPDILARWCEQTPGATAFILACGIVVVPKVGKQIAISRERRKAKPFVEPAPRPQPVPPRASDKPAGGFVVEA
jgi:hypothetical protein